MLKKFLLLMAISMPAFGAPAAPVFDPAEFQVRFNKADVDKDGKLSREEAFNEFPRMPEFFDEIDMNSDGMISLQEVRQAMERRVNSAMDGSRLGKRYIVPVQNSAEKSVDADKRYFSSRQAAKRYYRSEFYESIARQTDSTSVLPHDGIETVQPAPQLNKKF